MTDTDELLRPEGMSALRAVREEKKQLLAENKGLRESVDTLRATNRNLRELLHNLRAGVITATNELVDLCEHDGAVRNGGSDV